MQEEEQAALDDEAERRRKRVQAWQEQRTKAQAMEEAAAQEAAQKAKGWSLEDDLDEVSPLLLSQLEATYCTSALAAASLLSSLLPMLLCQGPVAVHRHSLAEAWKGKGGLHDVQEDTAAGGVGRTDDMEEDELDPLDAFMNDNAAKTSAPKRPVREPTKDEDLDPLDAFMSQNVPSNAAPKQEDTKPKQEHDEDIDPLDAFMAAEIIPVANGPSKAPPSSQVSLPCL